MVIHLNRCMHSSENKQEDGYYYFIYIITNKINGKKYIGMHQTKDIDDGYMGSGVALRNAYKKHGIENFVREILMFAKNSDELVQLEQAIVTPDIVADKQYYNLKEGGTGFTSERSRAIRNSEDVRRKLEQIHSSSEYRAALAQRVRKLWENEAYRQKQIQTKATSQYKQLRQQLYSELTPEQKKEIALKRKPAWTPERRAAQAERLKKYYSQNPDALARKSSNTTQQWALKTDAERDEFKQKRRDYFKKPGILEKFKEQKTAEWTDERRVRHSQIKKKTCTSAEYLQKQSIAQKALWTPEKRAERASQQSGRIAIHNPATQQNKRVFAVDVERYTSQGWQKGRKKFN